MKIHPVLVSSCLIASSFLVSGCASNNGQGVGLGYAPNDLAVKGVDLRSHFANAELFQSGQPEKLDEVVSEPVRKNQSSRSASLKNDKAPKNSYEKAPKGAFASRNYKKTRLNKKQALAMINQYRASKNLKRLSLNSKLSKAAKMHAKDLAKHDRISHFGFDGSDPWQRIKKTGYRAALAAENVGTGQASMKEVFVGWKKSPGHNENLLLSDATQMGIALVKDAKTEYKTFWVLELGSPLKGGAS